MLPVLFLNHLSISASIDVTTKRWSRVEIIDENYCRREWKEKRGLSLPTTVEIICGKTLDGATCISDLGAPLFCLYNNYHKPHTAILQGMVDFTVPCTNDLPSIFIAIKPYAEAITQHLASNSLERVNS